MEGFRRGRGTFLAALVAIGIVAALALAVADDAIVVELLVVGPVIAAFGATSRETAIVALIAVLASIPIGIAGDAVGSTEFIIGTAAVAIVGLLSMGIARLRSARELDAARLSVQFGVARVLSEAGALEDAAPNLIEAIGLPLGWRLGHLWEVRESGELRLVGTWTAPGVDATNFQKASRELDTEHPQALPGQVRRAGEPAWITDYAADESYPRGAAARLDGIGSGMAFPVGVGSESVAVVELFSQEARRPDAAVLALTEALGTLVGEFIEGLRSAEAVRRSEAQLEAILRGVADAVTAQAPDGRLLFANEAAVDLLGYESSEALLAAPREEIMSRFELLDEVGNPFALERLPGRRALVEREGSEVVVRFRVRATGEERWSAVKATPISDRDGRVTMAINVIEDITDHKRAELGQRFLSESSALLGSSLDTAEVLSQVASLAVPEVADWCAVDLAVNGEISRVALAHQDPAMIERANELSERYPPNPRADTGVPAVLRSGRPQLYPEIPEEMIRSAVQDEEHYRLIKEIGMRSAMIVPMVARGRGIGALSFVSGPSGRRFDEFDLELVEELARRCAIAIDNARLFSERAYIARTLQQSLLPAELPDIPNIEAAARFRPTGEGNEVGGDFYDLFESGGRGWTVVMGDVCGKGPDAAAVTALARYTLRAAAMRERLPSRALRLLNEALLRQRDDRRFCTVAYAYLETQPGGARVGVASGGHPLPMLLRKDGAVEAVGEPGTLLGVLPDPNLEDRSLDLEPGDALVFYTDGVIEGRGAGVPFDEGSLVDLLAGCAGAGADAIAARVEDAAVSAQGGHPRDDIAVLVLRVAA
jgi:PAS domain S-box-containing protein